MHELAATQELLQVALGAAHQAGAGHIAVINLVIGDLNNLVDSSVQFYADVLSRETPAEGAILRFRHVPAVATCLDCGSRTAARVPLLTACPACSGERLRVAGGRECYVESIEVDDAD